MIYMYRGHCKCMYEWWPSLMYSSRVFFGIENLSTRFYLDVLYAITLYDSSNTQFTVIYIQVHIYQWLWPQTCYTLLNKINALQTHTHTDTCTQLYPFLSMSCIYYVDKLIVCIRMRNVAIVNIIHTRDYSSQVENCSDHISVCVCMLSHIHRYGYFP